MPQYHAPYAAFAGRYSPPANGFPLPDAPGRTFPPGMRRLRVVIVRGEIVAPPPLPGEWAPADDRPGAPVIDGPGRREAERTNRVERRPAGQLLFPGSGRACVVAWRDLEPILRARLAHPERLRPDHRLRCQVQVYEALRPQRIEDVAARIFGDPARAGDLHPLTDALIRRLDLYGALPPGQPAQVEQRVPGTVLAGDRLAWLCIAEDPTADPPEPASPPVAPAAEPGRMQRRTTVPEHYLKPWELRRSREEAIFDMQLGASGGFLRRLLRRLRASRVGRAEMLRWQVMLSGKSLDDQLWAVRPPVNGLANRTVRGWVESALAHGGYEVGVMLAEWEIYWRRKA